MKRFGTGIALLLLLATALVGCGGKSQPAPGAETGNTSAATQPQQSAQSPQPAQPQQPATPARIKVGLLPIEDGLPFWVAAAQGYFQEAGVEVELVNFKSADERDVALTAGQIDGAITDTVASTTLVASGAKVKIISLSLGATPAEGRFAVLASPKSQVNSLADLKGVPVAISNNSIIHYVTDKLLEQAGFAPNEIHTLAIPQIPVRFEALMNGQIEAATLPDPLATLAEHLGARVLADDTKMGQNLSQSVILFSEQSLAEKGDGVRKMLAAYNKAVADIVAEPNKFRHQLVEKARLPKEIQDSYPVNAYSPAQLPTRDQLGTVSDWLVAKGVIKAPVAYEALVNGDFLPWPGGRRRGTRRPRRLRHPWPRPWGAPGGGRGAATGLPAGQRGDPGPGRGELHPAGRGEPGPDWAFWLRQDQPPLPAGGPPGPDGRPDCHRGGAGGPEPSGYRPDPARLRPPALEDRPGERSPGAADPGTATRDG